jgi:hypothetical protein
MKSRALLVLFLASSAAAFTQSKIPLFEQGLVDLQGRTQLIADFGSFDVLAEVLGQYRVEENALGYHDVTVGGYYRLLPNLKVGAFYRLQAGARHDDDVVPNPAGPVDWKWTDTANRLENVFMLDVSPRFLLPFLPGGNWVLMLKSRFLYSTYQNEMSILARPELTWFWMQDRLPLLNVSFSYEMYFPLNFGQALIYQSYPYLSLLWHVTPDWGIELAGAYKRTAWSTSQNLPAATGWIDYTSAVNSWVVSLGAVITLSF